MKKTLLLILLGAAVIMPSCSSPHVTVVIAPDYETYLKADNVLSSLDKKLAFGRGRFMDKRKDPSLVGFYSSGYRATVLRTDQAADDILFDGLKNLFIRSGHAWTEPQEADILVDVVLHQMATTEGGVINAAKYLTARMEVQLSFVDGATGRVFYTEKYYGSSEINTPFGGGGDVLGMLQIAIINGMFNVGSDVRLARAIINQFKTSRRPLRPAR